VAGGLAWLWFLLGRRSGAAGSVWGHHAAFLGVAWDVGGELGGRLVGQGTAVHARALGSHAWGHAIGRVQCSRRRACGEALLSRLLTAAAVKGDRRFTSGYTARMGHWDFLVDHFASRLPAGADRSALLAAARDAGAEMEMLAGQSFGPLKRHSVSTVTFGMPFVEVPGILVGSEEGPSRLWPIPSPVDPGRAFVAQVAEFEDPPERAMPLPRPCGLPGASCTWLPRRGC
jgi:hypothetical protein